MPLKKLRQGKNLTSFLPFGLDPNVAEIFGVSDGSTPRSTQTASSPSPTTGAPSPPPLGKGDSFSPFGGSIRGKPALPTLHESRALTAREEKFDHPLPSAPLPTSTTLREKGRPRADTTHGTSSSTKVSSSKDYRQTMQLPILAPPPHGRQLPRRDATEMGLEEEWEWASFEAMRGASRTAADTTSTMDDPPARSRPRPPISVRFSHASLASAPSSSEHGMNPARAVRALEDMSGEMLRQAYPFELQRYDLGGTKSTTSVAAANEAHGARSWREPRKGRTQITRPISDQQPIPPPPNGPLTPLPIRSTSLLSRHPHVGLGDVVVIDSAPEGPLPRNDEWRTLNPTNVPRTSMGPPPIPLRSALRESPRPRPVLSRGGSSVRSGQSDGFEAPLVMSPTSVRSGRSGISENHDQLPLHLRPLPPTPLSSNPQNISSSRGVPQPSLASRLRLKRPSTAAQLPAASSALESAGPGARKPSLTRLLPLQSSKVKSGSAPPAMPEPYATPEEYSSTERDRPPTRMSAREEPPAHPRLMRVKSSDASLDERSPPSKGMTALSFLALEDPYSSHSRAPSVLVPYRDPSVSMPTTSESPIVSHILPPKERSKIGNGRHIRNPSAESIGTPPSPGRITREARKSPSGNWNRPGSRGGTYTGTALHPPPRPRGSLSTSPIAPSSRGTPPLPPITIRNASQTPSPGSIADDAGGISPITPISPWRYGADAKSAPPTRTSFFDTTSESGSASSRSTRGKKTKRQEGGSANVIDIPPTPSPGSSDVSLHLRYDAPASTSSSPSFGRSGASGRGSSSDGSDQSCRVIASAEATPRGPRSRSRAERYIHAPPCPPTYNRVNGYTTPHALAEGIIKSSESLLLDPTAAAAAAPATRYANRRSAEMRRTPEPTERGVQGHYQVMPPRRATGASSTIDDDDASASWSVRSGFSERAKERKAMNEWLAKPVTRRAERSAGGVVVASPISPLTPADEPGGWSVQGAGLYGLRPVHKASKSAVNLVSG